MEIFYRNLLWKSEIPCSQQSVTGTYLWPDESNPHSHALLLTSTFLPTPKSRRGLCTDFPIKILYALLISTMRTTCPASLIRFDLRALKLVKNTNYESVFMEFSPLYSYFLSCPYVCSLHPVLKQYTICQFKVFSLLVFK